MDNVKEDMEAKKLPVQRAMVPVRDRNKWKHQVRASSSLKWRKRAEEEERRTQSTRTVMRWRTGKDGD